MKYAQQKYREKQSGSGREDLVGTVVLCQRILIRNTPMKSINP